MKVYIKARGLYQVQDSKGYSLNTFESLLQANSYIREQG